jgi:pimeloyl-ACP methyl ester carboxylesterase
VKASPAWSATTGAKFSAGIGQGGSAHLTHYTVTYEEWGDGPPLILVPGLAGGYALLGPLARLLAKDYRVISYQLRGEDDSFALRRPFTLNDLVNDLAEFIDWRRLESPVIMGVSFGAVLALEYAARFPHRLEALILQGTGARYIRGVLPQVANAVLTRFLLPNDNPFVNQFFNLLFGGRQKDRPLFEFVTRQCWQTDQSVMAHRLEMLEQFDITDRLDRVRAPALVLTGERDLLVPAHSLDTMCSGLRKARDVRIPRCGHLAFATHAERVAAEVRSFLNAELSSPVAAELD